MTEPITSNRSFIVPNTSDLPGAWGTAALNPNFQSIDTLFGGVTTISLSSTTTILLTVPATTGVWPGGNPSQSMNALIRFTGAQTGSATIQFTLPGFYIVENQCTGTTSVRLSPSAGTGNSIGAPPGQKCHVFYDGTHMDYVDMPTPGSALDLHINTTTLPPWMTACTLAPYLIKDGSTYSTATYTALAQLLGSTYGGNGITTFGVPDERARARLGVDTIQAASGATSARVTFGVAGFTGSVLGAAGGDQRMPTHNHGITDPTHGHVGSRGSVAGTVSSAFTTSALLGGTNTPANDTQNLTIAASTTGITVNNAGTGSSANMMPSIVSFIPLIKTVITIGIMADTIVKVGM